MKRIITNPTESLMRMCGWVAERVNEDVMIAVFCVAGLIIAFCG